jgi:hypothetical protein
MTDPYREYIEATARGPLALFRQIRHLQRLPDDASRDQWLIAAHAIRENIEAVDAEMDDERAFVDHMIGLMAIVEATIDRPHAERLWVRAVAADMRDVAAERYPSWAITSDLITTRDPRESIRLRERLVDIAKFAPESAHDIRDALSWCAENAPWAHLSPALLQRP